MPKDIFTLKQFSVRQEICAMKVGTDAILLGAWADFTNASRILDIGAGTGIISLMAAQRNVKAEIDAIEIDNDAAKECHHNFLLSKWANRLHAVHADILNFHPEHSYDIIITNPPFFCEDTISPLRNRAIARNNSVLPFPDLFRSAKSLLSSGGKIALIASDRAKETIEFSAGECNLWLHRRTAVRTVSGKPIKRWLWEFTDNVCQPVFNELIVTRNGARSEDYKSLTDDFYL